MDSILSVLATIAIIFGVVMLFNFMIFIHELGHFFAARWRGLYVDRFQIWFGRPIWKKTVNGVQWGLGWIPAGGFVSLPQMAPMEAIEGRAELPKDLKPVTPLDKIIVAAAGPAASFLLAVLFAVAVWIHSGCYEKQPRFLQQSPLRNDFAAVLLLPATFPEMHDFLFDFCIP